MKNLMNINEEIKSIIKRTYRDSICIASPIDFDLANKYKKLRRASKTENSWNPQYDEFWDDAFDGKLNYRKLEKLE
jgi:hypothetical protein